MKTALIVAALGLLVSGAQLVHSSGYGQESSYASGGSSYGGSDGGSYSAGGGGGGYDDHANPASYGVHAERPRVNLGISLKVPAMKINLGRMNMPRISIRAKIKQSHAPKVINVPEMHIDTNSKIPGPQGAQAVGHHGGDSYSSYGSSSSSYGGESASYGGGSSGYGQSAPSYGGSEPSYSAPSGPSYGSSGQSYESAGGYGGQSGSGGYSQGQTGGYGQASAGGYEMSSGGYEAAPASYETGPSYSAGGHGGAVSYEPAEPSYSPSYSPAASHAPATTSYSDSPAPTQYGRKPYGASSAPVATGGYGPTGPSNYNAGYNGARPMASPTRSQYGSSASAYNAPQQQYQSQQQSYASQSRPSQGYGGASGNFNAAPLNSGYQAAGNAAYGAATGPTYSMGGASSSGGYQATRQAASYKPAPTYEASGYSNVASAYEPTGYQPLEPGHTLITASNDNYDGLTRMAVASNPPKEHPKYPAHGPSVTYETPSSYSSGGSNNYASGYNQKAAPVAPATYSAPAYGQQNNQYNANQHPSAYQLSSYDDGAAPIDQGNYGVRTGSSGARSGAYVEAY